MAALNLSNCYRDESPLSICRSPAGAPLSGGLMRAGPRMPAFCRSNAFPKAALQAKAITRRVWLSALPETACVYRFAVHSPVEAFAFACRTSVEPVGLQRAAGLFSPSRPRGLAHARFITPRRRDVPVPGPCPARPSADGLHRKLPVCPAANLSPSAACPAASAPHKAHSMPWRGCG